MLKNIKNILIVEDEVLLAQQLKQAMLKHGYRCAGIAIDYKGAQAILDSTKVDLVLLDIKISGEKTGIDVAQYINANYGLPFMFMTSYNDEDTLTKIKALHPKGYINKPLNHATLLMTMDIIFDNMGDNESNYTSITIGTTTYNINLSELLYVEAEHVYIKLHYQSKNTLIRSSLTSFLELMPKNTLVQISRGVAINPKCIEKIEAAKVTLAGVELKRSKNYATNLDQAI